jgi:hypothetical protein
MHNHQYSCGSAPTKNNRERSLLGVWQNAIQAAGNGDFSQIRAFPKNTFVGGIRLATSDYEVQRILEANEARKEPFEGLYRTLARPS